GLPSGLTMDGIWSAALTSSTLNGIVTSVSIGTTAVVFHLCRRSSSRRSIVPAVLTVAAITIAFAMGVRPIRMSADRALYNDIQARLSSARAISWKADDLDRQVTWWQDIQSGVSVIPSALIGVVLARRRGWRIASRIVGIVGTWSLLVCVALALSSFPPP